MSFVKSRELVKGLSRRGGIIERSGLIRSPALLAEKQDRKVPRGARARARPYCKLIAIKSTHLSFFIGSVGLGGLARNRLVTTKQRDYFKAYLSRGSRAIPRDLHVHARVSLAVSLSAGVDGGEFSRRIVHDLRDPR